MKARTSAGQKFCRRGRLVLNHSTAAATSAEPETSGLAAKSSGNRNAPMKVDNGC